MLLRRVLDHVKGHNWVAVVIDLMIVVVGIFLGLQVNNWNEARALEHRKAAAIERLHDESEQIVAYFRSAVGDFEQLNESRTEALQRLVDRNWVGADTERMTTALASVTVAPAVAPPRSVYDELISTGLFAEVGDVEAREKIAAYYSTIEFLQGQVAYVRDIINSEPRREFAGARTVFDPTAPRQRRRIYDFEALSADRSYVQFAINGNANQQALTGWWREALVDAEAMCAELARLSHEPCEPPIEQETQ